MSETIKYLNRDGAAGGEIGVASSRGSGRGLKFTWLREPGQCCAFLALEPGNTRITDGRVTISPAGFLRFLLDEVEEEDFVL